MNDATGSVCSRFRQGTRVLRASWSIVVLRSSYVSLISFVRPSCSHDCVKYICCVCFVRQQMSMFIHRLEYNKHTLEKMAIAMHCNLKAARRRASRSPPLLRCPIISGGARIYNWGLSQSAEGSRIKRQDRGAAGAETGMPKALRGKEWRGISPSTADYGVWEAS